jgi:hypothetical protein
MRRSSTNFTSLNCRFISFGLALLLLFVMLTIMTYQMHYFTKPRPQKEHVDGKSIELNITPAVYTVPTGQHALIVLAQSNSCPCDLAGASSDQQDDQSGDGQGSGNTSQPAPCPKGQDCDEKGAKPSEKDKGSDELDYDPRQTYLA